MASRLALGAASAVLLACLAGACQHAAGQAPGATRTTAGSVAEPMPVLAPTVAIPAPPPPRPDAVATAPPFPATAAADPPPAAEPEEMPPVRRPAVWRADSSKPGPERVAEARAAKLGVVQALFAASGVAFPPAQMLLRGFKRDRRLELWAASGRAGALRHVTTYEICYASGDLGPKRREGDAQVPEGFYVLDLYNPSSRFHLSMQVSYPNESDRILGDRSRLGGEIMIHGNCVSIGCLAMSDERIQELWVATTALRDAGGKVHVHIFPARDIDGLLGSGGYGGPEHHDFWRNLKDGKDRFERTRTLPRVRVDPGGRYLFD